MTEDEQAIRNFANPGRVTAKPDETGVKIEWTEPEPPKKDESFYDHVFGTIGPLKFRIEWKSWKPHDSFSLEVEVPAWLGSFYSLDEAKAEAAKWVASIAAPTKQEEPVAWEELDQALVPVTKCGKCGGDLFKRSSNGFWQCVSCGVSYGLADGPYASPSVSRDAGWQDISTAPKDGSYILARRGDFVPEVVKWLEYEGRSRWSVDPESFMSVAEFAAYFHTTDYAPTRWLSMQYLDPLPALPTPEHGERTI